MITRKAEGFIDFAVCLQDGGVTFWDVILDICSLCCHKPVFSVIGSMPSRLASWSMIVIVCSRKSAIFPVSFLV